MNFNSVFEELSSLYEEKVVEEVKPTEEELKVEERCSNEAEPCEEACAKKLEEATNEEETETVNDEAPVEEVSEEEPAGEIEFAEEPVEPIARQLILECSKCGAIIIKDEADVVIDEESDLVNIEEECPFCEETEGYKIIGVVAPYEAIEEDSVEVSEELEPVEANDNADLNEYYDAEAPLGRDTPYYTNSAKSWGDPVPQWWLDQGGTRASWNARNTSSGRKWDEETGGKDRY